MNKIIEKLCKKYNLSLSDIDLIFNEGFAMESETEGVDYIYNQLKELPDEIIESLFETYLNEDMQTSGQINSAIGKNRFPYETEFVNII